MPQFPPEATVGDAQRWAGPGPLLCPRLRPGASKKALIPGSCLSPAMQGPAAPGSPRGSPRGSPALFRKLMMNQSIRLQRRFTVAHPLW